MNLESIEEFINVPVSIQLRSPLANHGSMEEVELENGTKCGRAAYVEQEVEQQGQKQKVIQPVTLWSGAIIKADEKGVVFDTQGYVNVPLKIFLPYDMIAGVVFAAQHVQPSKIIPE